MVIRALCMLFATLSMSSARGSCFDRHFLESFSADMAAPGMILNQESMPLLCEIVFDPQIKSLPRFDFSGGDWFELLTSLAIQHHWRIHRTKHLTYVDFDSGKAPVWPWVSEWVELSHVRSVDLVAELKDDTLMPKNAVIVPEANGARIKVSCFLDQMESIVALVRSKDLRKKNYRIDAKVLFVHESLEAQWGMVWKEYQGWLMAWPSLSGHVGHWLLQSSPLEIDNLLQQEGVVVVATPYLLVASGEKAMIESGTDWPYVVSRSGQHAAMQFKKAGTRLEVTITEHPHHNVQVVLDLMQEQVSHQTKEGWPVVQSQHVAMTTEMSLEQRLIVGGMYRQKSVHQQSGYLWPKWVPFFGRKNQEQDKQQLVVLLKVSEN